MAKSFTDYVSWYKSPETRSWKRKVQCLEIILIDVLILLSISALLIHDGPKKFETVFYLFGGGLFFSSVMLCQLM